MPKLIKTGKKWLGLDIMKPAPGHERFTAKEGQRTKDTQSELEKIHRSEMLKRSRVKGMKIRSKDRAYDDLRQGYRRGQ